MSVSHHRHQSRPGTATHLRVRTCIGLLPILCLASLICPASHAQQTRAAAPRNIILMIGDGMGSAQISALRLRDGHIQLERFPVGGASITHSASYLVTESAAGGTALATGMRTRNGFIAMDTTGVPHITLLERAHATGRATGVAVTCAITHATPAAFLAHTDARDKQHAIAAQIAGGSADVLIGGGTGWMLPTASGGTRTDHRDLMEEMRMAGWEVRTIPDTADARGRLLMLLAPDALPPAGQRNYGLSALVGTALAVLSRDPEGFVLMVEGSQIDWAAHDNSLPQLLAELRDFDAAVGRALDFAEHDGHTLVVVTADHETGGLALSGTRPDGSDMAAAWSSTGHTATMVPLFAYGPGATRFGGIHDNDEIGRLLQSLLTSPTTTHPR